MILHLRNEGFHLLEACYGFEALQLLDEQRVDLVILDIMMPEMDGWELCRRLREEHVMSILMVTAKGESSHKVKGSARQAGEPGYLPADNQSLSALARGSRNVLLWLARIFALCVVVQVFFAGAALFSDSEYWTRHSSFPRFFAFLPVIMIVLSFFTKLPVSIRVKCFQLFAMILLMFLTAVFSSKIGILSALHPVIAIMLFVASISIEKQIVDFQKSGLRWTF